MTTFAGSGSCAMTNGIGTAASFNDPYGLAYSAGILYVLDRNGYTVRKVSCMCEIKIIQSKYWFSYLDSNNVKASGVVSTFAGSGVAGFADGVGTAATFYAPEVLHLTIISNLTASSLLYLYYITIFI